MKQAWPESVEMEPDEAKKTFESASVASTESYHSKSDYLALRKHNRRFYCIVIPTAAIIVLMMLAFVVGIVALGTDVVKLNTQVQQLQVDNLKGSVSILQRDNANAIKELQMVVSSLNASLHHNPRNSTLQNLTVLEGRVSQLENQSREHVANLVNSHRLWLNDTVETLYEFFEQLQTLVYGNTHEIRRVDNATQGHLHRLESTLTGSIEELASVSYRNISQLRAAMATLADSVDEVNAILKTLHIDIATISSNLTQLQLSTLGQFMSVREDINSKLGSIQEHFDSEVEELRQELNYDSELEDIRSSIDEFRQQVNNGASNIGGEPLVYILLVISVFLFV